MREGYEVTSFVMNHMKIADMRPKVEFKISDVVRVSGTHITGLILKIDCDHRLAYLTTSIGGDRWFYLKDLVLEKQSYTNTYRKPDQFEASGDSLFDDFFERSNSSREHHIDINFPSLISCDASSQGKRKVTRYA